MTKKRSWVSLLIAGFLLTSFVTRGSFASGAGVGTSGVEVGLEPPTHEGGISESAAPFDPADVPVAESETNSTNQTVWGWYYSKTAQEINEMGKQSNLRPITLTPKVGAAESNPHFNVLFVRNAGAYKVDDWQVVANRTVDNAKKLETPTFRNTGWRVSGLTWHKYQDNSPTENRLATIQVQDNLYKDYDIRSNLTQAQLQALSSDQGFRVVDFDSYRDNQGHYLYAAVIVPNKGVHYKHWAWLFLTTKSNILNTAKKIDDKPFRVTDIERREDNKYDALLVESLHQGDDGHDGGDIRQGQLDAHARIGERMDLLRCPGRLNDKGRLLDFTTPDRRDPVVLCL